MKLTTVEINPFATEQSCIHISADGANLETVTDQKADGQLDLEFPLLGP